jgi:glutaminyl-peptide cyclotransferase
MRLTLGASIWLSLFHNIYSYTALTNEQASILKSTLPLPLESYLSPESGSLIKPILIPRPSGSDGAARVLDHFQQFFMHNVSNWFITIDEFTDSTPRGNIRFQNFVATRDPPGVRTGDVGRLVVAAHYDSKFSPPGFIGATDSAVPCAMLMYAALALEKYLGARDEELRDGETLEDPLGLQVFTFSSTLTRLFSLTVKRQSIRGQVQIQFMDRGI